MRALSKSENTYGVPFVVFLFLCILIVRPVWALSFQYEFISMSSPVVSVLLAGLLVGHVFLQFILNNGGIGVKRNISFILLVLLATIVFIEQLISIPWVFSSGEEMQSYFWAITTSTFFDTMLFIFIGINIKRIFHYLKYKNTKLLIMFYWIFAIFLIIGLFKNEYFSPLNFSTYQIKRPGAQYLIIADSFAIFSFLLMFMIKRSFTRIIYFFISSFFLFISMSRASFYIFVLTGILIFIVKILLNFSLKVFTKLVIGCFLIITLAVSVMFMPIQEDQLADLYNNNRIFGMAENFQNDSSYTARNQLLSHGIINLKKIWIFGEFLGEMRQNGEGGTYIHNWLSFWASYGIIPMILFVITFGILIVKLLYLFTEKKYEEDFLLMILSIGIFVTVCIVTSRAYTYSFIWLWMAAVSVLDLSRQKTKSQLLITGV